MTTDKKRVMRKAVGLARATAENDHDPGVLRVVESSIDAAAEISDGRLDADALDHQIAEQMRTVFRRVEPDGPLWALHLEVAEAVLDLLDEDERAALWARTRWADAADPALPPARKAEAEPWEEPVSTLSEPLADEPPAVEVEMPEVTSEPVSGDEEIIEAEVVEVDHVTSAQRTYRMPPGQYYAPGAQAMLGRSISGRRRPVTEISTSSPDLADQR
ncbi:hypothetical protein GPOL_c31950 [Gordonia polyisoprenivorans VH2]|uniref:Uncharacterized protein n=1 Tax=Gordonia polyisoprenivorans (strain DSM 44266 / VH2) TaxID=1112204 RepID=H6MX92_GORPV|nr:hypothetical protein [Gordonia polyisoprenivorans]AFA74210.1 hypothetical protein GPOL_c31950 [Gordonia polyisoprenivorans VH2]